LRDFQLFEDLIGIPFKRNGRDKNGMDCWGLCMEVKKRTDGTILPDFVTQGDKESIVGLFLNGIDMAERLESPEPYCFVCIGLVSPLVDHVGIVLKDCRHFIHMLSERSSSSIERLDAIHWRNRIRGYYRWKHTPKN